MIEIEGPMPTDPDAIDEFLIKALAPEAIKGAWIYPIVGEWDREPNVSGGTSLQ